MTGVTLEPQLDLATCDEAHRRQPDTEEVLKNSDPVGLQFLRHLISGVIVQHL